ncbi:hypothetical protein ACUYOF_16950 [Photobacterium ganghwense]|uniref:hypothetical protein n=1 Tax=Photobacterium ganghwense TaxID=320778 RepID=UPI0040564F0E
MRLNVLVVTLAVLALVFDKFNLIGNDTHAYVNAPVWSSERAGVTVVFDSISQGAEANITQRNETDKPVLVATLPGETNSSDLFEQRMFPNMNRVVLGGVVIENESP